MERETGPPSSSPREFNDLGEITVLVVDDEQNLLSIVASRLKDRLDSLQVVTAKHGTEAVELLEQLDVDCILGDYHMPGMDGLELLEKARQQDPDVPFILFTSKESEAIALEAIDAGVTDFLQKNLDDVGFALLANRLENVVREYRMKKRVRQTDEHVRRINDCAGDVARGIKRARETCDCDELDAVVEAGIELDDALREFEADGS